MLGNEFKISYASKDQAMTSKLAEQLYYEDLNTITDIEENSVSFRTLYIFQLEDKIEVKVFIINSTTRNINFEAVELSMVNKDNDIVASELIKLTDVGEIPPKNARPYSIFFNKTSVYEEKTIDDSCRLVMQLGNAKAKASNKAIVDYIDEKLSLYEKRIIESYIENMSALMKNQLKLMPYKSSIDEDGTKFLILIAANSYDRNARLENINILYKDIVGLIQASKKIDDLPLVKANSVSVFKIILEQQDILREPFNPERCEVTIQ